MLNGKFFTGLPPKMIDRDATGRNRMESHIFWPDDTKVESPVDAKLRRRNSIQAIDLPVYQRQASVEPSDVDTRKRFSKEFSQSSIQFYDNLNDNKSTTRRRPLLHGAATRKTDVTEKPTATKMELPDSVVDDAYTAAKKKQAYMSKIEFYDFVNEQDSNRNNLRKPRMDMNNKREMELNSKNSPKLQVKRNVRSLSEEKDIPKLNNRDIKTAESTRRTKDENLRSGAKIQDKEKNEEKYLQKSEERDTAKKTNSHNNERSIYRERDSEDMYRTPKESVAKRSSLRAESRYANEGDIYRKSTNPVLSRDYEIASYRKLREPEYTERRGYSTRSIEHLEDLGEDLPYRRLRNDTKRANIRSEYGSQNTRKFMDDYEEDLGRRMKTVRIQQSPPRQHRYEREEEYFEREEEPQRYVTRREVVSKRGNAQRHTEYNDFEPDLPYEESIEGTNSSRTRVNRVANRLTKETNHRRDESPQHPEFNDRRSKPSTNTAPDAATSEPSIDVKRPQKHLRSSLFFHDGAIIAENDATQSPTSQQTTTRRNARTLAASKRVTVGLPD